MTDAQLNKALRSIRRLCSCLLLLTASQSALAFNFIVNDTTDAVDNLPGDGICETLPANGVCTLRAAIQESNAWPGTDSIHLPAGIYLLSLSGIDNTAVAGDLDITEALSLRGVSQAASIIDGNGIDRVIDIRNVDVQIENLTIRNGLASGVEGGGIRSLLGALTIRNSTLDSNETTGFGFGGGGLYNTGSLVVDNVTITNNRSSRGGGLLHFSNDMIVTNSRINNNVVDIGAGSGGGVFIQSTGNNAISNTTIDGNIAELGGGGGIYSVNGLTLTNSTVSNNNALLVGGGGIYDIGLGPLTIINSTLSGNIATGNGGGIQLRQSSATVINSTIYNNQVLGTHDDAEETYNGHGGGIYITSGNSITLTNTIISDNTASVLVPAGGNCYSQSEAGIFEPIQTVSLNTISSDSTCELNGTGDQANTNPSLTPTLAPNGGATLSHSVLSSSTAVDLGTNSGCPATDQRGFPRPVNGGSSLTCDIGAFEYSPAPSVADLGVVLEATMNPAINGSALTYNLTVTNYGPDTANNVVLTDLLGAGISYTSDNATCNTGAAPTINCSLGVITAGSSQAVAITVTANSIGSVSNTATVSATESDPNSTNDSATITTSISGSSDLSVSIIGSVNPAVANLAMSYTVTLSNNGPDTASHAVAAIQFDTDVLLGATIPSAGTCNTVSDSGLLTCDLGSLNNGASANVTITAVPQTFGAITHVAYASFSGADPIIANNTASVTTNIDANASLSITTIDAPDPAFQNADIFYSFTVANSGPSTANNTQLVVTFPTGLSLSPAAGASPANCSGAATVTCNLGSISGGLNKTVTLVAIAATAGSYSVTSSATSNETGAAADIESTLVNPPPPTTPSPPDADLLITMVDIADPVVVGNSLTYNITATNNNGPNVAQNVVVTVTLPPSTIFNSASTSCVHNSGVVTCNFGALSVDDSATASITVTTTTVGTISALATVSDSVGNDSQLSNNSVSQATQVNPSGTGATTATSGLNSGGGGNLALTELGILLFTTVLLFNRRGNKDGRIVK